MADDRITIVDGFTHPGSAGYLARNYPDYPLAWLPGILVRRLVRGWSARGDVVFRVALRGSDFAGFALWQAVGPRPWRELLVDPLVLPLVPVLMAARKVQGLAGRAGSRSPRQSAFAAPSADYPPLERIAACIEEGWAASAGANVEYIFVEPECRGQGIGESLLESGCEQLKRNAVTQCYAYIAHGNIGSQRLFERSGFRIFRGQHNMRAFRELT